tara:strand:- start:1005 stop:1676 length:672 start_codon:yes stop_codon:yes gene_type:complete
MSKIKIFNKAGTLLEGLATGYMEVSAFYQKPGTTYQEFDPITLMESFDIWNVEEPPEASVILAPMNAAYPTWTENDSVNTACQWKDAIVAAGNEPPQVTAFLAAIGLEDPEECEEENSEEIFSGKAFTKGVRDEEFPAASLAATTLKIVVAPSADIDPAFYTETILVLPVTSTAFEGMYTISGIPDIIDIKLNQITRDRAQEAERRTAIDLALATSAQNKVEG